MVVAVVLVNVPLVELEVAVEIDFFFSLSKF